MDNLKASNLRVKQRLEDNGLEDVIFFTDYSYEDAIIGVSNDNRLIYDYEKMVYWLVKNTGMTQEEATDWIDYNTLGVLHGDNSPIIMYGLF